MHFLHPGYLWFLFLVAIPIVIHLFNFRRYKVLSFSNLQFLQQLQQESVQRNKIKHWLVLLARILTITALVFAFAQPFIPFTKIGASENAIVSIYLDNSFSMRNTHNGVANFELARRKAVEIVKVQKETAQIQVISASCAGHEQRLLSKKDALRYIEELNIVPFSPGWNTIIQKQKDVMQSNKSAKAFCYYLSDFQDPTVNAASLINDSSIQCAAIPFIASSTANVSVDTCWLAQPIQMQGQKSLLLVRLKNYADNVASNVRISLTLNKTQKYVGAVSIPANGTSIDTIPISIQEAGYTNGLIHINDEPVNFDNDYYFNLYVKSSFVVYCLCAPTTMPTFNALAKGFKNATFVFSDYNHINYNQLEESDVVILADAEMLNGGIMASIEKRAEKQGLSIVLFPSDKLLDGLNPFLNAYAINVGNKYALDGLKNLDLQDPFFKDMFRKADDAMEMPTIKNAYQLSISQQSSILSRGILYAKNEMPVLISAKKGNATLFVFSFSLNLENTNFIRKALFAAMMAKMMLASSDPHPLAYELGDKRSIELPFSTSINESALHLTSAKQDIIPEQQLVGKSIFIKLHDQLQEPGSYQFGDKSNEFALAFNYSRKESLPSTAANAENWAKAMHAKIIASDVASAGLFASSLQDGIHYWQWLIVLALLFILIEVLLLRYWR